MGYRRFSFDGGTVEYLVAGPPDARDLLLFHVGSPGAAITFPGLVAAAAAHGMRTAVYSRGGYGESSRRPGRTLADEAAISAALADRLGHGSFRTAGWSGGGPVALACAALLPERVRACIAIASLAPRVEAGDAWMRWTPKQELPEWEALASDDQSSLLGEFEESVARLARMTARRLRSGGPPADRRAIEHDHATEVAPYIARMMRRAVAHGYFGYLDDSIAQARDWGFRVADIRVPVVVRHGELDRMVTVDNGRWLAAAIPGARAVFLDDAGHGSVGLPWSDVIGDLVRATP